MAVNRNSFGYSAPDVINERAEAASARDYGGGGLVLGGVLVGEDMPDRLVGLTGAVPIAGKSGVPTNHSPQKPVLNVDLNRANAAAQRKGTGR